MTKTAPTTAMASFRSPQGNERYNAWRVNSPKHLSNIYFNMKQMIDLLLDSNKLQQLTSHHFNYGIYIDNSSTIYEKVFFPCNYAPI